MQIKTRLLTTTEEDQIYKRVAYLFSEMYKHMEKIDLPHKLAENGEYLWINTIKKSLGKLNAIVVAFQDDLIVGFAAGNLRLLPNYLGSKKVGYYSHCYVTEEYRSQNIGNKLTERLENWFAEKSVKYIELEVLIKNEASRNFCTEMGYIPDNLRMTKRV